MPSRAKSRSKIARKKAASKKAPRQRTTRVLLSTSDPLDAYLDAAALALGLSIEEGWRPAIKANLAVNLEMAASVAEVSLPDETEPAPIFRA